MDQWPSPASSPAPLCEWRDASDSTTLEYEYTDHQNHTAERDSGISSPAVANDNNKVSHELPMAPPVSLLRNQVVCDVSGTLPMAICELRALRETLRREREVLLRGEEHAQLTVEIVRLQGEICRIKGLRLAGGSEPALFPRHDRRSAPPSVDMTSYEMPYVTYETQPVHPEKYFLRPEVESTLEKNPGEGDPEEITSPDGFTASDAPPQEPRTASQPTRIYSSAVTVQVHKTNPLTTVNVDDASETAFEFEIKVNCYRSHNLIGNY